MTNRMAGGDEFQSNLRLAQQENEDKENAVTAGGSYGDHEAKPNTVDNRNSPKPEAPEEKAEDLKNKYVRDITIKDRDSKDIKRAVPEGLDPDLVSEVKQGEDWGNGDQRRYMRAYDKKYGTGGGEDGGVEDFPTVTDDTKGSGQTNNNNININIGKGRGKGSGGDGRYRPTSAQEQVKRANARKYGDYGSIHYDGPSFADKAVKAAAARNPVDFKALDQRIHDRPLYSQAQADIKHAETFGDTWSWDSAPKWETDRFKAGEQENRYEDVMKKNKYD